MSQHDPVSAAWRAHRAYLVDLAFRMVGDIGVAEDMVQEAFSRLLRAPVGDIDDERGWLRGHQPAVPGSHQVGVDTPGAPAGHRRMARR